MAEASSIFQRSAVILRASAGSYAGTGRELDFATFFQVYRTRVLWPHLR